MERFSINAIIGKTTIPEPNFEIISKNPIVDPSSPKMLNSGGSKFGRPAGIFPKIINNIVGYTNIHQQYFIRII